MGKKLLDTDRIELYDRTGRVGPHDYRLKIDGVLVGVDYDDWSQVVEQFYTEKIGDCTVEPAGLRILISGESVEITVKEAYSIKEIIELHQEMQAIAEDL